MERGEKILESDNDCEVLRLKLGVGERVSPHKHLHCSEHWVVISGVARVSFDDDEVILHKGEGIGVGKGIAHEVENYGKIALELVEVRTGEYFGMDDCEKVYDDIDFDSEEFCVGPEC